MTHIKHYPNAKALGFLFSEKTQVENLKFCRKQKDKSADKHFGMVFAEVDLLGSTKLIQTQVENLRFF